MGAKKTKIHKVTNQRTGVKKNLYIKPKKQIIEAIESKEKMKLYRLESLWVHRYGFGKFPDAISLKESSINEAEKYFK